MIQQTEDREQEIKRLKEYDNLVIVDYIKSYVDILMGLKIEQSNLEKVVSSSRGGDLQGLSHRSDASSLSNQTEPPKKYEELI